MGVVRGGAGKHVLIWGPGSRFILSELEFLGSHRLRLIFFVTDLLIPGQDLTFVLLSSLPQHVLKDMLIIAPLAPRPVTFHKFSKI